ncbi:MAG: tail fiber domain-containing protein [Bacteroidales bacterium]|nr:tail fiber domain-containing protein [Bacteroidales bacterium]
MIYFESDSNSEHDSHSELDSESTLCQLKWIGILTTSPGYPLEVNGDAAKPGGGTWLNSSDERLKDIQDPFDKGLDELALLNPVHFNYKENNARQHSSEKNYVGFIAQEVQELIPEAVKTGEDGYLNMDMHVLQVAMINALKELKAENDNLEKRLVALEKKLSLATVR